MPVPIDIRVSPSLDPETLTAIPGYNDETAGYVADAFNAFQDSYITVGKIHDAADAAKQNPAWTDAQRHLHVGKTAAQQQDRLARRMDLAMSNIDKGIKHIEGELSRPLKERAGLGNLNVEVRAHVKGLERPQRTKLLNEAFETGDLDTLHAILGAQPFLTGLSQIDHEHYVRRFHEWQNPQLVARLNVMRGASEKLGRDGPLIFKEVQKAVGAKGHEVRAIDAANQRAVDALNIQPS